MSRKKALIILSCLLIFALADSLITNWLIMRYPDAINPELNPLLKNIAGTPWLVVLKVSWVLLFMELILKVTRQPRWCDILNGL